MGQSSNNPFKEGGQFISDYTIQAKNIDLCLTYLLHKKNQKEYLLRELTFNDIRQFTIVSQKIKNRKNISNAHLTNLQKVYEANQDQMCSNIYKLYTLWEYPIKNLAEEINERALQKKRFDRKELSSILACSIMGLATFQKNQIKHQCLTSKSIMMSKDGNVKIVDPLAIGSEANIESVHNNRNLKNIYLSPEQCESIQSQKPIINKNSYKNDVFTLGMIILECGLLERKDDCYMDDCSRINWQKIQINLNRFGEFYGEDQKKLIELMLKRDIRVRPDWLDLNNYVDSQEQISNLMQSDTHGQISVRKTTKRETFITRTIANPNVPRTSRSQTKVISPNKRFNQIKSELPNVVNHLLPHMNQANPNSFYQNQERNSIIPQNTNYVVRSFEEPGKNTNTINNINKHSYNFSGAVPYPIYEPNRQSQQVWRNISAPPSNDVLTMHQHIINKPTPVSSSYNSFQLMQKQAPAEPNRINSTNVMTFYEKDNANNHQMPFTQRPDIIFETNSKHVPIQDRKQFGFPKSGRMLQPTPKVDNNKYSTHQGVISGFESKLPFNNSFSTSSPQVLSTYIKPTESFNYQVLKQETPPQSKASGQQPTHTNAFDLQFTKTPEIVDHSELEIHPQYVEEYFKMGSRYEGYKLNGMRHGKGKFYYQDGGSYDGQWKQNKMNGFGTLYYQSNLKAYEGQWVNDQFQGNGILYNQHPIKLQDSFDYKNFDQIDDYWERYQGQFTEDLKNGKGRLIFSNGEVFQGIFKEDMVEGEGIFHCRNERRIHGIWNQNVLAQQFS